MSTTNGRTVRYQSRSFGHQAAAARATCAMASTMRCDSPCANVGPDTMSAYSHGANINCRATPTNSRAHGHVATATLLLLSSMFMARKRMAQMIGDVYTTEARGNARAHRARHKSQAGSFIAPQGIRHNRATPTLQHDTEALIRKCD